MGGGGCFPWGVAPVTGQADQGEGEEDGVVASVARDEPRAGGCGWAAVAGLVEGRDLPH